MSTPKANHTQNISSRRNYKVFNDPVHGHIEMHPLLVKIIDTQQFQRLRYIKQLGGCYLVFPGATHTRFEHSIGVCHLAGELVESIKHKQPELGITPVDVLCVKIAGLCHDLGHGPFSHMFDRSFIPKARPDLQPTPWKHEDASVKMLDHLLEVNNLKKPFLNEYGITDDHLNFVKHLIQPKKVPRHYTIEPGDKKAFLCEIVANKKNEIDVDKWDYFTRDSHHLGITISFDYRRCMQSAHVVEDNGEWQIAYRDKEVNDLYDMFYTRHTLHSRAYKHKTTNMIEKIMCDALLKADEHLKFPGKNGRLIKLSESIDDMYAYTNVTDYVLHQIMLLPHSGAVKESKALLERIYTRNLYKFVVQAEFPDGSYEEDPKTLAKAIVASRPNDAKEPLLMEDNLFVDVVTFSYGMDDKDPIKKVVFYTKGDGNIVDVMKIDENAVSGLYPKVFKVKQVRVYCDDFNEKEARKYFDAWCTTVNKKSTSPYAIRPIGAARKHTAKKQLFPQGDASSTSGLDQTQVEVDSVQTSESNVHGSQGLKRKSDSSQQKVMADGTDSELSLEKKLKQDDI